MINTNICTRFPNSAVTGPSFITSLTLVAKSILRVYQRMQLCTLENKVFYIEDGVLQQKRPLQFCTLSYGAKSIGNGY